MLKPSVYMRLFGLAAGASLAAAVIAYVKTDRAPSAKAPVSAARPAPPAPTAQGQVQAPDVRAQESAAAGSPGPASPAAAPSVAPKVAAAPEPTGSIAERARPPAPVRPAEDAGLPPTAHAALVDRPPAARSGRLDLNSASVEQINRLRGAGRIGRRVVKFRPYRSPEDLVRKRVISRAAYTRIKDQVRAGRE